jgi:hypothetical protein
MYRASADLGAVRARGLDDRQVYVPGGFFVGWVVENELEGSGVPAAAADSFRRRELTGPALFEQIGGVIDERILGDHALDFARFYLDDYWADMAEEFPVPSIFDVRDTWHNYEWMRIRLVARYSEWRSRPSV